MDGDVIVVKKSEKNVKDQIFKNLKTNIYPEIIKVYVSGRVYDPGEKEIPNGSTLSQLISLAGGIKPLSGKVELIRLSNEGVVVRKVFKFNENVNLYGDKNPILMAGDVVRVKHSPINKSSEAFTEITSPFTGIFSFL